MKKMTSFLLALLLLLSSGLLASCDGLFDEETEKAAIDVLRDAANNLVDYEDPYEITMKLKLNGKGKCNHDRLSIGGIIVNDPDFDSLVTGIGIDVKNFSVDSTLVSNGENLKLTASAKGIHGVEPKAEVTVIGNTAYADLLNRGPKDKKPGHAAAEDGAYAYKITMTDAERRALILQTTAMGEGLPFSIDPSAFTDIKLSTVGDKKIVITCDGLSESGLASVNAVLADYVTLDLLSLSGLKLEIHLSKDGMLEKITLTADCTVDLGVNLSGEGSETTKITYAASLDYHFKYPKKGADIKAPAHLDKYKEYTYAEVFG
ncbi:MAG: hypothetical protein J6V07_02410 [Clostridia bacterium]|nr:hypothetical protein [Clostridia bacterium]